MHDRLDPHVHTIDAIGDAHGHAVLLETLLDAPGYTLTSGTWRRDRHLAVFVGDLMDNGPDPAATLAIAKAMTNAGVAMTVLGNHERNRIRDA